MICELCKNKKLDGGTVCNNCGYDSELKSITNKNAWKNYYGLITNQHWSAENEVLLKLYDLGRYSYQQIGDLIGKSKTGVHNIINLAKSIRDKPELKKHNKTTARNISNGTNSNLIFDNENEMQEFIYKNWQQIPFVKKGGWSIISNRSFGKFETNKVGEIDFLAKNEIQKKWLILEIKKNQTSDDTIGQILRYIGWVKKEKAKENEEVEGIIICGEYDIQLDYALNCIPLVQAQIYRFDESQLFFYPFIEFHIDTLHKVIKTEGITPDQKKEIVKKLISKVSI